jgi:hypothetical protein
MLARSSRQQAEPAPRARTGVHGGLIVFALVGGFAVNHWLLVLLLAGRVLDAGV